MSLAKRLMQDMLEKGLIRQTPSEPRKIPDSKFAVCLASGILHRKTCYYGRRIKDRHRRDYKTSSEAIEDGFRGCRVCWPTYGPQ